jgi:hypothetical protein
MTRVTASEVKDRMKHGDRFDVTAVDARSEHAWNESDRKAHNAVRIPPDANVENYAGGMDRHNYVVTYCT